MTNIDNIYAAWTKHKCMAAVFDLLQTTVSANTSHTGTTEEPSNTAILKDTFPMLWRITLNNLTLSTPNQDFFVKLTESYETLAALTMTASHKDYECPKALQDLISHALSHTRPPKYPVSHAMSAVKDTKTMPRRTVMHDIKLQATAAAGLLCKHYKLETEALCSDAQMLLCTFTRRKQNNDVHELARIMTKTQAATHMMWVTELYSSLLADEKLYKKAQYHSKHTWARDDLASGLFAIRMYPLYSFIKSTLWTEHGQDIDAITKPFFMRRYFPPHALSQNAYTLNSKQLYVLSYQHTSLYDALKGIMDVVPKKTFDENTSNASICKYFAEIGRLPICLCRITDGCNIEVIDSAGMFQCRKYVKDNAAYYAALRSADIVISSKREFAADIEATKTTVAVAHPICAFLFKDKWIIATVQKVTSPDSEVHRTDTSDMLPSHRPDSTADFSNFEVVEAGSASSRR
jgi:hypothetical protein